MKRYLLFITFVLSKVSFADCIFPNYVIEMAKQTGGGVSCQDKDYYQNKIEIDKLKRIGIEGNCIKKGEDLYCKSGTSIKYEEPYTLKIAQEQKKILESIPIKKFLPINEPNWFDRPKEPGQWYGENCIVRVWEQKDGTSDLIMYRHGGRKDIYANISGNVTPGIAYSEPLSNLSQSVLNYSETIPKNFGNLDFSTVLSFSNDGYSLQLVSKKVGHCVAEAKDSECIRAEGFIIYPKYVSPTQPWRLNNPVKVIVEDSCAKHQNNNFLDSRPFLVKIPLPH